VDLGDFIFNTSETSNPTINQDCEGEEESPYNTTNVNKQVTFSDNLDYEIHNKSPVGYSSQPNKWQMPDKINLDSSGLQRSA
jgi:hypothetical protein